MRVVLGAVDDWWTGERTPRGSQARTRRSDASQEPILLTFHASNGNAGQASFSTWIEFPTGPAPSRKPALRPRVSTARIWGSGRVFAEHRYPQKISLQVRLGENVGRRVGPGQLKNMFDSRSIPK
jgi:hypothetical protein